MIANEAIKWLLNSIVPRLSIFLIDGVKIETGDYLNKASIKQIEVSFSLKPYIDYVMKVNGVVTKKARITFSVSLPCKLENIQFPSICGSSIYYYRKTRCIIHNLNNKNRSLCSSNSNNCPIS